MADYETITVGPGELFRHTVTDGEVFENKLIDITADGAGCELGIRVGSGTGAIRNVGVKGVNEYPGANGITPAAENADGHAIIENVYLGDGASPHYNGDTGADRHPGIWVDGDDHVGLCTIRRTNVQSFTDNGIYASGPAAQMGPANGGDTHIESSFVRNNNISGFRIGTDGSYVKDSVAVVDGTPPDAGTGTNGRCIWMRGHSDSTLADNVEVYQAFDWCAVCTRYSDDSPLLRNSHVEGGYISPDVRTENVTRTGALRSPPDGCPTTAEEAASGSSSPGGGDEGVPGDPTTTRPMVITGPSGVSEAYYSFEVYPSQESTPAVVKTGEAGPGADPDDTVTVLDNGNYLVEGGAALGGTDTFDVTGYFKGFESAGDYTFGITVDGLSVSQSELAEPLPEPGTATVTVTVTDGNGGAVASEPVTLEDRTDGEAQSAHTDMAGQVTFVETVGPTTCNDLYAILPDRGMEVGAGCLNDGESRSLSFTVETGSGGGDSGTNPAARLLVFGGLAALSQAFGGGG